MKKGLAVSQLIDQLVSWSSSNPFLRLCCISCGLSESNCPEVFKVKAEGSTVIEGVDYSGLEEKIKQAAEACPVEVIKYDEDDDLKNVPPPINRSMGDWD